MATFQGFTFHMPTSTITASKEDMPELDMDLDEIVKARMKTNKPKNEKHNLNERRNRKEPQQKKFKTSNNKKTDRNVFNKRRYYPIEVPEAALREILLHAGIKTENYNIKLIAERK